MSREPHAVYGSSPRVIKGGFFPETGSGFIKRRTFLHSWTTLGAELSQGGHVVALRRSTKKRLADRALGYEGSYDAVRRYARVWRQARGSATAQAYVPLSFAPGEAYQFDWSHEIVLMNRMPVTVKVAHLRLCHSRMPFVRAYPRESQEMVFEAHARAFEFYRGACTRGIYDNMKTAVETVFVGKDRQFNSSTAVSCKCAGTIWSSRPPARRPQGGRRGQVENQVGRN